MKINLLQTIKTQIFGILIPLSMAVASIQVQAATVALADAPLVNSTTADVLPNVMYILDNSGSMSWQYMPDYVDDFNKCKDVNATGTFTARCNLGDPPFMSPQFNGIYYNPANTYSPGLFSNGVERDSMTAATTVNWTQVRTDPYNRQNSDQVDVDIDWRNYNNGRTLVSFIPSIANANEGYPDKVWCNIANPTNADLYNPAVCKRNSQYVYPTNTGLAATTFNVPRVARSFPYYYTIGAGEYCTDKNLTNCITATAPTGAFTFPANLRWCNSAARTNCQAKYIESTSYIHAKWTGYQAGSQASGTIKILPQSPANTPATSPTALAVSNITVDGVPIIAMPATGMTITDTTNAGQRSTLATNIRNAINAYAPAVGDDFVAAVSGDTVTLTRVGAGPFAGTLDITTTAHTTTPVAGTLATGSINITRAGRTSGTSSSLSISNVRFGPSNITITNGTVTTTNGLTTNAVAVRDLATKLKDSINAMVSSPDFTASCAGGVNCTSGLVTITAVTQGVPISGNLKVNPTSATGTPAATTNVLQYGITNMNGGVLGVPAKTYTLPTQVVSFTGGAVFVSTFNRVDIEPSTTAYPKAASRTDCLGATTCTYAEEMTNFANWYSYYRTRMQMMKTSTSRAFKLIDARYRVGFITIANQTNGTNYLPINKYDNAHKTNWYQSLVNTDPITGTPLRTALSTVGRIFAGKKPIGNSDPMQYSCQQNFSILTTDGYWNGGVGTDVNGAAVGDRDGGSTPRPMLQGNVAVDTLSDVAKYYYDEDIRDTSFNNCTGGPRPDGSVGDVCENNVFVTPTDNNVKQHMTTFTLGLGVDAVLNYQTDYQTAITGDFADLKQGTLDWPVPVNDSQTAVDDLWHAAVNGQGKYFSAKDPNQLSSGLNEALQSIGAKAGAGAAAAASNLSPVAGDNAVYFASYQSVKWTGNLEARSVNIDTGAINPGATWSVEDVTADSCVAPSAVESEVTPSGTQYYCVTPSATLATCGGAGNILDGTNCKVPVAVARTGTLKNKVAATTDSRTIYMKVGGALGAFNFANVATSGLGANYSAPFLSNNLSQWNTLTTAQKTAAEGANYINFLRGQTGFEARSANLTGTIDNRIFRLREAVMGDPIESTPVFVGAPKQNYSDPGYGPATQSGTFKNTKQSRAGIIYLGTNDGMLHAFDSATGEERWAYVPTAVIPNMWKLGDKNYGSNHANFVNGDITVHDYCESGCSGASAVWKTILIGGLGSGGKGYYALDVTDPFAPQLKWEFGVAQDKDVGFSYGNPLMTKKANGDWIVLLTSGYNNTDASASNPGKGVLFVLNPSNGAVINKLATSAGSAASPSGLAKINIFVDSQRNNMAKYVYGGDLEGNLWRFDISQATPPAPFKMVAFGVNQPITTKPELSIVNSSRIVFVGTGKYLEISDLEAANFIPQTIYAITDTSATTLTNPRTTGLLVQQSVQNAGGTRTQASASTVDYNAMRGWYVDWPDSGERVNVAPQLVFGTLVVPSIVPSNTICSPGGSGWINYFDYKTGGVVQPGGVVSIKTNSPIVGINVFYIKGKGPVFSGITADGGVTPPMQGASSSGTLFNNHGVIWRELIEE